jgi:endogenous inhibitor of DNA gyrase (YacG/DUF329 family)
MSYRCPTCKKAVEEEEKYFPFCSERCRWVDLGRWLDEDYRIPAPDRPGQAGPDGEGDEGGDGADIEGPPARPGGVS